MLANSTAVPTRHVPHAGVLRLVFIVFAACVAALFAHITIDLAGDVVLAHDTYDGVDHRSRSDVIALGIILVGGALLHGLYQAVRDAHDRTAAERVTFADLFGPTPGRFVGAVVVTTIAALAAMEVFDLASNGLPVDDAAGLFGGSFGLGLGIAIPSGIIAAIATRLGAQMLEASRRSLTSALARLITLLTRAPEPCRGRGLRFPLAHIRRRPSILARRSGKRGPPLLAS